MLQPYLLNQLTKLKLLSCCTRLFWSGRDTYLVFLVTKTYLVVFKVQPLFNKEFANTIVGVQVSGFSPAHEVKGSGFFKTVLTRNAAAIAAVYAFAEGNTFNNLRKLLTRFAPWGLLGGQPNLDEFVASHVTSIAAAEQLFENTKAVQRDLHRAIPAEVTEGCFIVSTGPFKAAVEAHVAAARASMSRAVFASAVSDRDLIADFTARSKDLLATQATSLSELGEARTKVWHNGRHKT